MGWLEILGSVSVVNDIFLTIKTNYNELKNKRKLEETIENFQENIMRIYENYSEELTIAFSDSNLERIKEGLKDESGYDLETILKDFIRNEIIATGIDETKASEISEIFIKVLLVELRYSAPEIYNQVRLRQKIKILDGKLDKLSLINYKTISDIEDDLLRVFSKNDKKLTLEFYNYEDKEFYNFLKDKIETKDRIVSIDGPSREETLYNVLYFFKNENYPDTDILIIDSHKEWEKIVKETDIKNKILIPNFYSEEIKPNLNNINIFIYNENEKLRDITKMTLYRRLRGNLENKLEELGYSSEEVQEILRKTNGVYSAVKRAIFDSQFKPPKWTEEISDDEKRDILKIAILLGKWESRDKEEIEKNFNIEYKNFINKLMRVINTEEPLILEHQNSYFLACPEEAWDYIKEYITPEEFMEFSEKAIKIISAVEKEYIENYSREYSIYRVSKYKYSETLKRGLLRSLILYNPGKNPKIVKRIFKKIFENPNIAVEIKWAYISEYILEICEISPEEVLEILINEFNISEGNLIKLFKKQSEHIFGKPNYYIKFIWAIEILIQVKQTSIKALLLLFKINDLNIKYDMSNSPAATLRHIFCAWNRDINMTAKEILVLAKTFVKTYHSGWKIIKNEIPSSNDIMVGSLVKPTYLNYLKNEKIITHEDYNYLIIGYINICLEESNSIDRFLEIMDINFMELLYKLKIFNNFKKKIENFIEASNDEEKKLIQDKIREIIHENRFFIRGIDDSELQELYDNIKYDNPIQGYRFLFENNSYEFQLLNPKNIEEDDIEINSTEALKFIEEKFSEFKDKGYNYMQLLDIGVKNPELLGKYIFQIFSEERLNKENLENLLMLSEKNKAYLGYINQIYIKFGNEGLREVLKIVKALKKDNLILEILLIESLNLENNKMPLIENVVEFKSSYWKRANVRFYRNEITYRYIINNFFKYLNPLILQELDFGKEYFTPEELLNYLEKINITPNRLDAYHAEKILKKIYGYYLGKFEYYLKIAKLELRYMNFKDIKKLKCFSYLLRKEPNYYSEILKIIYKKKKDNEYIDEKLDEKLIKILNSLYSKIEFCPSTNETNDIKSKDLLEWIENFKVLLEQQNQLYLFPSELGKLFANSPKGTDGFYPHESVRKVIENFSGNELKELQRSYEIKIYRKRGVYTSSQGKSELKLSNDFKENADQIRLLSPNTADIYDRLSESYKIEAEREKESAIYIR